MGIRQRKWTWKGKEKSAWVVDYFDAKGKRRLKTFRTKREADDWRSETRIELKQGTHVADRDSVTVAEAGKLWLATCEANELERATLQLYRQHLDLHIAPLIGTKRLNELTVPALRDLPGPAARQPAGRGADEQGHHPSRRPACRCPGARPGHPQPGARAQAARQGRRSP